MSDNASVQSILQGNTIILFDGVCKLCHAWSRFIIKYDKYHVFKLCSVQSKEGKAILRHFNYPDDYYETMLLVEGNSSYEQIDKSEDAQCFEKSEAFFRVMSALGWPWRVLCVFRILPPFFRDWMYDRIALNRYKIFGKYDQCLLPTADHNERFL